MSRVGCAVLAAGGSRRLGAPKQLVEYRGVPLVRRAAVTACASSCDDVAVVVGHERDSVREALVGVPVGIVVAEAWAEGIGRSIRAAVQWARRRGVSAIVLATCDQPLLTAEHLDNLVAEHALGAELVASAYAGVRGVPAIFAEMWFDSLAALAGDRGAAGILRAAPEVQEVPWSDGAFDVDEDEDVARLRAIDGGDRSPVSGRRSRPPRPAHA